MIKQLRKIPVAYSTPQCCVMVNDSSYSQYALARRHERLAQHNFEPGRCTRPSSYEIDGKSYCTAHAGKVALKKLIETEMTT